MLPANATRLTAVALGAALVLGLRGDAGFVEPLENFPSRPDLRPPHVFVTRSDPAGRSGYVFLAPWRGGEQSGPMILDGRGRLVWFHPLPPQQEAMDFRVQRYRGRPVLTWWEGFVDKDGYGHGEYVIADRSYHEIARLRPADGGLGDFHEFQVTPRGTALVTVYRRVPRDLSAVGGPVHGTLLESMVQEIDIATGKPLLVWRASDHVALSDSHEEVPDDSDEAFDFFHVNAIDVDDDGNLLVSSRHTDTVYKLDRRTGKVLWRLGGPHSDFRLGSRAHFHAQHDIRRQPDGDLTLFDNSNPPQRRDESRAIRLQVDERTRQVTLDQALTHPLPLSADSQGNMQVMPRGDTFVGWGSEPYFSRYGPGGRLLFDAHFPRDIDNYRAFDMPWRARPPGRPAIFVDRSPQVTAYASWNGATQVARWQLLAGTRTDALRPVASAPWQGFETTLTTDSGAPYVAVRAMSARGQPLGTSRTVRVGR